MAKYSKKHPGFEKVSKQIAKKQHLPIERAERILAAQTRKAGAKARAKNPRLKNVKGK